MYKLNIVNFLKQCKINPYRKKNGVPLTPVFLYIHFGGLKENSTTNSVKLTVVFNYQLILRLSMPLVHTVLLNHNVINSNHLQKYDRSLKNTLLEIIN